MIVLDTNVIGSGLVWRGSVPARVLARCADRPAWAAVPDTVYHETARILTDKFALSPDEAMDAVDGLEIQVSGHDVYGPRLAEAIEAIKDLDDAPVVAVALLLDAPVVSGDRAFHPLKKRVVETFTPRGYLDRARH